MTKRGFVGIAIGVAVAVIFVSGIVLYYHKFFTNQAPVSSTVPSGSSLVEYKDADDETLQFGNGIPEFGGFYLDGSNVFVYLLDTTNLPQAEAAIRESFKNVLVKTNYQFIALKADYSFGDLLKWKRQVGREIGYDSLDLDEKRNRVVIGIVGLTSVKKEEIKQKLLDLSIPQDAVIIEETKPIIVKPGNLNE